MSALARTTIEAGGHTLSVLRGGSGDSPVLFLHGGLPGRTLHCSGAHMWGPVLELVAREGAVVAPDLPGFGDSAGDGDYRVDAMVELGLALIRALGAGPCHVVGHDEGGLVALGMGLAVPDLVRSVAVVASPTAAPTGDSIENLTLAYPPGAPWSRVRQAWSLGRISRDASHINAALLDRCVACVNLAGHRTAAERGASAEAALSFAMSVGKVKGGFYTACREGAYPVPIQIVWGAQDPLTTIEHGRVLYGIVAARQTAAHFHLINGAGNLPFRERPADFHHVTAAFRQGMMAAA